MPHYKVLALMRVSTKEQDIERQKADIDFHIQRFAEDGIDLEVVETFLLQGISGAIAQSTPEFKRMLARLARPDVAGILISQLDRFLRPENPDAYAALKVFRIGKKLMFCDAKRPLDITNSEDRSIIINTLEQAFMERRRIKHRTHSKKEQLVLDPTISITRLPQGVRHIRDVKKYGAKTKKGWFEYIDFAHSKVKPAFERVAAGESLYSVAKSLGFATRPTLRDLLKNKWWIGIHERSNQVVITYNEDTGEKIRTKRPHPKPYSLTTNLASKPLVSAELFERIQVLLAKHHETFTFKHSHANDFLFNGILFCGKCGSRFYLKNDFRCHQPATYYCSSFRTKRGTCGVSRYPAQLVDDTLFDICAIEFKKKEWVERVKAAALNSDQAKERRDELAAAQERLNSLEKKKAKAQRLYMADDSDETAFNLVMVIKRDIAESKLRLATAKADAEPFGTDDASEIAQVISARWKHPEKWTFEERKKAIQETIERIILSTDGRSTLVIRGGLPIPAGTWYADFSESKEHANRVKLS